MIRSARVIPEFLRKGARPGVDINNALQKGPAIGGAFVCASLLIAKDQWPKNSHNRIITGIGTQSSQSRIPRPILAFMNCSWIQKRKREAEVPASGTEKLLTSVRCSASRPMAPPAAQR